MTSQLHGNRRVGRASYSPARILVAFPSLVLLLAGCDGAVQASHDSATGLGDQLAAFVADFAREALAAWLL